MRKFLTLLLCAAATLSAAAYETSDVDYGQTTSSATFNLIWEVNLVTSGPNTVAEITGVKNSDNTANPYGSITVPYQVVVDGAGYIVQQISSTAFNYQIGITDITIPSTVKTVEPGAFIGCELLESISVESSSKRFSSIDGCLYNYKQTELLACPSSIESISLPVTLETIDDYAFAGCFLLSSVTIPESADEIGDYAFWDCEDLESVTFAGDAPSTVGTDIFCDCDNLETIYIPSSAAGWPTPPEEWQGIPTAYSDGGQSTGILQAEDSGIMWHYRVINGQYAELLGENGGPCISKNITTTYSWDAEAGAYVADGADSCGRWFYGQ